MATSSISTDLLIRVRELYAMAYQEISSDKSKQVTSTNGLTDYAIPAFILSVAAVESFANEYLISRGKYFWEDSSSSPEDYKAKRLVEKLIEIPPFIFGQTVFEKGQQLFQDIKYLIVIRNIFVHYKMETEPSNEKMIRYLTRIGVSINSPKNPNRFWAKDLCTVEGIRWAHNTAVKTIRKLIDTAITEKKHTLLIAISSYGNDFFHLIPNPETEKELWLSWINRHHKWNKV